MEIIEIDRPLEIGEEMELKVILGGNVIRIFCTPVQLEELITGFLLSEGLSAEPKVIVEGDVAVAMVDKGFSTSINSSGCAGIYVDEPLQKLEPKVRFSLSSVREYLTELEADYYRRTRAYHTALIVSDGKIAKGYDVGRHNAVDKAIGMAYRYGVDFSRSFLMLSGRITAGIAKKAIRVGIPLVVSKAAILNSAIELCERYGLSAISFASGIAVNSGAIATDA
ncbi:MAG: formate dehydrogenase accessory sulfurtransferase FdhD [Archaeoglobi archaeon]|nr:formate dehydrogenase accessory sulfurtransferase FdhD [Archaeoglobi archaeon]